MIGQAAWFASLLTLAALVPPRSFGLVSAGMVIVSIATLLVGSGTRGSIIVAERLTADHIRYALFVNVGSAVVLTGAMLALAGPIVGLFSSGADASVLQGLSLSVGVFALSVVPMAVLQREMRFKEESWLRAGSAIVASIVAIVAAALGAGVWALVLRQVLNSALLALLAWIAARPLLPTWRQLVGRARRPERVHRANAGWFFVLAMFNLIAMSMDYVIVGRLTDATQLGLYSLAFTLGFAPLTQFSWRLGEVIFPAVAATTSAEAVARRTLRALTTAAAILLPAVPVAMALVPWLLPAVFGDKWSGMITPLEILLPVGVVHAITNMIGEALSGTGNADCVAKMQIIWTLLIVPALIVLVRVDGIVGASLAHVLVAVPVVCAYLIWGGKRLGIRGRHFLEALTPVLVPVAGQATATLAVLLALDHSAVSTPARDILAAAVGLSASAVIVSRMDSGGLRRMSRSLLASVARIADQS